MNLIVVSVSEVSSTSEHSTPPIIGKLSGWVITLHQDNKDAKA
jgi:hypothetical protein